MKHGYSIALFLAALMLLIVPACRSNTTTSTSSTLPVSTTAPATSVLPSTTPPPTTTPTSTSVTTSQPALLFNFDSASPALSLRQGTPFDQTNGGLTAHFSSAYDPGGFSVQNPATTFYTLSTFSGNYLKASASLRNTLIIRFDRPLNSITLSFATVDYHDPGAGGTASNIKLNAYLDSSASTPVGTVTAHGEFSGDSYPQGVITLQTQQTFNLVTIEIPYLAQGAVDFLVDNISVVIA